ncbi:unnamed protein product [Ectocarpus sp. 12 AP-2014]
MASSSNLELLATICLRAENESCGGIDSGGGGDGANHEETVPIEDCAPGLSQELAATQAQAVVAAATPGRDTEREQPVPAREALVVGDVGVQAAGEAGAGDVMPTSSALVMVAQAPGEAQRLQKSRSSHDLLGHAPPATPAPAAAGEEEQGTVMRKSLGSVVSTAPATPAPAAAREKQEEVVSEALAAAPQGVGCILRSGGGKGTGGGRGQTSATSLDLLATAACLGTGTVASEVGSAGGSGSGSENGGSRRGRCWRSNADV